MCELKGYSVQNRMDLDRPKQSEDTETAEQKVWFVTGTSRGLGRALAEEVLRRGDVLMATARKNDLQKIGRFLQRSREGSVFGRGQA